MDKGESVGIYVARVLDVIDRSGLPYKLGPLGTCIEGNGTRSCTSSSSVMKCFAADCSRIACTIKMDWRKGHAVQSRRK